MADLILLNLMNHQDFNANFVPPKWRLTPGTWEVFSCYAHCINNKNNIREAIHLELESIKIAHGVYRLNSMYTSNEVGVRREGEGDVTVKYIRFMIVKITVKIMMIEIIEFV